MEASAQTVTSTTTIIISVLSSSLLTAAFTKLAEFYFNKVNYKKDYYKIILEKRLNSYETLLNLLFESGNMTKDLDEQTYSTTFETSEKILSYFHRFWAIQNHRMWLSRTVDEQYSNLLIYLNDSINKSFIHEKSLDNTCVTFAKTINREQVRLGRSLHLSILCDMKNLYKVDEFFDDEIVLHKREQKMS
ncbi:hypothetical protein [Mucilaginibacter sp.]